MSKAARHFRLTQTSQIRCDRCLGCDTGLQTAQVPLTKPRDE
jgi:hypothetical protein